MDSLSVVLRVSESKHERRDSDRLAEAIELLAKALGKRNNEILERIEKKIDNIMATQAELTNDLKLVHAQQVKTAAEIADLQVGVTTLKDEIKRLEEVIATGVAPSQELVDAVAAVKAQAEIVDQLIPDLPVAPTP